MKCSTLLVLFGTLWEDVLLTRVDPVSVKVMRLEEPRPELLLRQVVRNILSVFLLDCNQRQRETKKGHIQYFYSILLVLKDCL